MENLHIGDRAKELLKHIYELAANSPFNTISECLLSDLAVKINSDKEFVCKCLCYLKEKGFISDYPSYGTSDGVEVTSKIQITADGIDLAEKII